MLPRDTNVLADAQAVAERACALISTSAAQAISARGVFRIVLAGGTTPQQAYALLAKTPQDWARWQVFWGDERCVPVTDPQRNSQWRWAGAQHFPIPAELGAQTAAEAYAQTIAKYLPFDLVLLGMGEDGHTASLFPGADLAQSATTVAVYHAPKPPSERVSLTIEALQACRQQLVLVTGASKAQAVKAWRAGAALPIAAAVRADAWVLLDQAATA